MAAPTQVFMLVDVPNDERTLAGLPTTTLQAYAFDIEGTIDETVQANAYRFPLGSTIHVTTDARCDTYTLSAQLDAQ